jgi:hypothetical protein
VIELSLCYAMESTTMRYQTEMLLAVFTFLVILTPLCETSGQEAKNRIEGVHTDGQPANVTDQLALLNQAIARLEEKIDRLDKKTSQFSPVEVRIVDENGMALSGFDVKFTSVGDVQAAEASGVSNDDGIGLARDLPYGRYWMRVRGNGWYARELVTVEVGKRLDLKVVAPAAGQDGQLALKASLQADAVENLPFGQWEVRGDNGWGNRIVPSSGEVRGLGDLDDWKTFPTLSDGAEVVAVSVSISVERRIEQPGGGYVNWEWNQPRTADQSPNLLWLVQSDGTIQPLLNVDEANTPINRQAAWFQRLAPEDDQDEAGRRLRKKRLGYHKLTLGSPLDDSGVITLPSGQITLSFIDIFGRPSEDVMNAIGNQSESSAAQVWLRATVSRESEGWLGRLLGDSGSDSESRFEKKFDLVPGKQQSITIGAGA